MSLVSFHFSVGLSNARKTKAFMQIPVQDKLMHTCLLIIGSNPSKARHCLKFPWAVLSQKLSGRKMWLCGKIQMDPSSYMKLPRPEVVNIFSAIYGHVISVVNGLCPLCEFPRICLYAFLLFVFKKKKKNLRITLIIIVLSLQLISDR